VLIVFSLVTGKPLYVKHNQISCKKCSLALTKEWVKNGCLKSAEAISTLPIEHEGKCHQNSKHSPAVAEEFACEHAGHFLLCGGTDGVLPDDEAIFLDEIVSDGDTKGPERIITIQNRIIGKAANGISDIGHFIKCISNGLSSLKEHDHTLGGTGLLEPCRICVIISSDIRKHLQRLHEYEEEHRDLLSDEELLAQRKNAVQGIYSVIPHHGGDHRQCLANFCKYKEIQHRIMARTAATSIESYTREDVAAEYAEEAWFKGKVMDIGENGRAAILKVITSKVTVSNILRLAKCPMREVRVIER
jgi:hypothetical protein